VGGAAAAPVWPARARFSAHATDQRGLAAGLLRNQAHVFASLRFDTTYRIPSYRRWLDETGHLDAHRFHRRFLQHLQHQSTGGGRWVLKCPDHVFALAAIRAVYPDARLLFVHRDPLAVLLSVVRLTEVLTRPFTRRVDKAEIGQQDSDRWLAATELMIAAAREQCFAEPISQVHYLDLVRNRVETVAALYGAFRACARSRRGGPDWPASQGKAQWRLRRASL
jgi:hypothetical protein